MDEPAIGAVLALQSEYVTKRVVVASIDGSPQAVEMIKACTPLIGTVKPNFARIAQLTVAGISDSFANHPPSTSELKVPALLVTRESLGVHCG